MVAGRLTRESNAATLRSFLYLARRKGEWSRNLKSIAILAQNAVLPRTGIKFSARAIPMRLATSALPWLSRRVRGIRDAAACL